MNADPARGVPNRPNPRTRLAMRHAEGRQRRQPPAHSLPEPMTAESSVAPRKPEGAGGIMGAVFGLLFGPIHYPAVYADRILAVAQRGPVVYVTRGRSSWLALYFKHVIARLGLPLAATVSGIGILVSQGLARLWKQMRGRAVHGRALRGEHATLFGDDRVARPREAELFHTVLAGESAMVLWEPPRSGRMSSDDYVRALLVAQRASRRPIFVAPHVLADRSQSGAAERSLTDRIFGDRRRPGRLRTLVMLMTSLRRASVRMADIVDLRAWLDAQGDTTDLSKLARKLRHELNTGMNAEERVVVGGQLLDNATMTRRVLRNPIVAGALEEAQTHKPEASAEGLRATAAHHLRAIAARYNVRYIKFLSTLLGWVFQRIYDGIAVDQVGLLRVIEASRKGPLVFCPSHRSHVDYLVLSFVLWQHGVAPPHIAAGANLSFFPLGTIFRGSGAFFLRRSFRDDKLYAAVFRAYVIELLHAGVSIEFFLEGTRSRTGKHLMPKFGLLGMLTDAWRRGALEDVQFVPVSIDYERIIEAQSYEKELSGAEKRQEDIGGLLRTTRVLRSRYGRVQVQFGDPVSLAQVAQGAGLVPDLAPNSDEAWRKHTERLGYGLLRRVAMVCSVTPTAVVSTGLLAHQGRGLSRSTLVRTCASMVEFLEGEAARVSHALQHREYREQAVLEAVQNMVEDGSVSVGRAGSGDTEPIYRVPDEKRVLLDYHKNAVMNYFAPAALVSRAMVKALAANGQAGAGTFGGPIPYDAVRDDAQFLSRLFKREFIFRSAVPFHDIFDDAIASLAVRGLLDATDEGTLIVRDEKVVSLLAALLDAFVEGYWITARTLRELRSFPLWRRELATRVMERIRRAYLEGEIHRPEAANRTLVESALGWMRVAGVLESQASGKRETLRLTPAFGGNALEELVSNIGAFRSP